MLIVKIVVNIFKILKMDKFNKNIIAIVYFIAIYDYYCCRHFNLQYHIIEIVFFVIFSLNRFYNFK